jgi:phosphohistidine phosphatase
MKNLILIRHAKSSWDAPLIDHDRPVSNRGIQDAHLVAAKVSEHLPKSYVVWSSTAIRAKNTAYVFAENLSIPIESINFREDLYTFDSGTLAKIIKTCDNQFDNLILFGHNDAITNFVNTFGNREVENIPTSGFVSMLFDTNDWKNLTKGSTDRLIFPRELKQYDPSFTG